jgi:hypothetical protein
LTLGKGPKLQCHLLTATTTLHNYVQATSICFDSMAYHNAGPSLIHVCFRLFTGYSREREGPVYRSAGLMVLCAVLNGSCWELTFCSNVTKGKDTTDDDEWLLLWWAGRETTGVLLLQLIRWPVTIRRHLRSVKGKKGWYQGRNKIQIRKVALPCNKIVLYTQATQIYATNTLLAKKKYPRRQYYGTVLWLYRPHQSIQDESTVCIIHAHKWSCVTLALFFSR